MTNTVKPVVLYVEDDLKNFEVAELRLGKRFKLLHAADDRSACQVLNAHPELSAVLMDVELQGSTLDGLALTKLMRGTLPAEATPDYARGVHKRTTPIIIVTAYIGQYTEQRVRELGADNYFAKPVDFVKLSLSLAKISMQAALNTLKHD